MRRMAGTHDNNGWYPPRLSLSLSGGRQNMTDVSRDRNTQGTMRMMAVKPTLLLRVRENFREVLWENISITPWSRGLSKRADVLLITSHSLI